VAAAKLNAIQKHILGDRYELSVAFLSPAKMRAVTRQYKHQNHVSNVLSFPLSKTSGEILICRQAAKPYTVEYLFVHGCLHLKGLPHGATMEREERKILARFSLNQWQKSSQASMSARTTSKSSSRNERTTRAKRRAS
jgi:ssRNA-specific RNase YbeY (16S rRNA maturation enzyme)